MNSSKESGVAIWYVLAGIVLFAALSYSFARSVSQSQSNTNTEQARIIANEILGYAETLRQATQRLITVNGCSENDISFYSEKWNTPVNYDNVNTPFAAGDFECHVFQRDGGGIGYKDHADLKAGGNLLITSDCGVAGIGTGAPEIVMLMRNVPLSVCKAVNRIVGVDMPSDEPSVQPYSCNYNSHTDGTFVTAGTLAGASREPTACLEGSGGQQPAGQYFIYSVIHDR